MAARRADESVAAPRHAGHSTRGGRSTSTIDKILVATIRLLREQGHAGMSMLEVSEAAGVARGTLYRYFTDKSALMDAVTARLGDDFERRLLEATSPYSEPESRLKALLDFMDSYMDGRQAEHFMDNEPEFLRRFQRSNFDRFVCHTRKALDPVFDSWDRRRKAPIDRQLAAEYVIRFNLSDVLVPAGTRRKQLIRSLLGALEGLK